MDSYRLIHTLQNLEHLGSSPPISIRLRARMDEPDSSLEDAAFLISQDPTICAQVLRIANSGWNARGNRIGTVSQAVVHLGLDTVKKVVFAIELIGLYHGRDSQPPFDYVTFWKHTLAGALIAHETALRTRFIRPDSSFLTGLFRNLGVLIIRQHFPELFSEILNQMVRQEIPFRQAARRVCGIEHREMAYLVGMRWRLPDEIVSALHGIAEQNTGETVQHLIHHIQIADSILHNKHYGEWDSHFSDTIPDNLLLQYHLGGSSIDEVCSRTFAQVEELSKHLFS